MATKAPAKKRKASVTMSAIPKLKLDMPLDEKKIAAIQRCLKKGRLSITVGKIDLGTGRLGDGWLYD